ncbi:MAG TPA: hypothetical protein VHL31_16555 [Geminicoccus sp.]|jgi:hypothetical protein|uniref:hypothetical protein n=1 Tax=Geminicoccus sp. TaxID=2024832 RepID=UPI002E2F30A4|nr:hypothetical protein [Geminicoccus sp.]HEX2527896.1 hypothetical protein [Geminicoccus sp.]
MHSKRRAALALMLARDSLLTCHRLARHIVDEIDGSSAKRWGQAYARRIELFESMMRCLIDYGVKPGDLQEKLKTVPTEDRVPVTLESVMAAEATLERHLEFSLRASMEDPDLHRLLASAFEEVRQFRTALEIQPVPADAQPGMFPTAASRVPHYVGTALQ